ncbi:MAG TPA: sucrase ferredoxin [Actinomycetota bacterium]|nr:sucrase ferredoxin [Actinomycetota bacterium]
MSETLCSSVSRALNESLIGTASRVRNWLLVEQPGPWGHDAVSESRLDPLVAAGLKRNTGRHRIRLLLIRRAQEEGAGAPYRCFAVHSGMSEQWVQRFDVDDPSTLLDFDLAGMREGARPDAGRPWPRPLYLVCTNGEHDRCCGRYGPEVARSLAEHRPDDTWESSHLGGDRFAANLVCLPHGLYFGRIDPDDAVEVAALYEQGLIHLDHFRGRSCYEPVVQAGDAFLRLSRRLPGLDDLVPEWRRDREDGVSRLAFRDATGRRHDVEVVVRRGSKRPITCNATVPGAPRVYVVGHAPGLE